MAVRPLSQALGVFLNGVSNGFTSVTLSAAATFYAQSFVAHASVNLTEVRLFIAAVTGTVVAGNMRVDIYSDNAGNPNTTLANVSNGSSLSASTWVNFTFNLALTQGVQYWIVVRNLNGTPASNNFAMQYADAANGEPVLGGVGSPSSTLYGWMKRQSSDSGSTWTGTKAMSCTGFRIGFNDGSYAGFPAQTIIINQSAGDTVYNTREYGVKYTTPNGVLLNVIGLMFMAGKNGTAPTGDLRMRIYQGTTLIATSASVPKADVSSSTSSSMICAFFTSVVKLQPNTTYRFVFGETTQSDTSANYYGSYELTIDSDANSVALLPFVKTYFDGTSWADTTTKTAAIWSLVLDSASGEYTPVGTVPQLIGRIR